jgi:hypothetical protein
MFRDISPLLQHLATRGPLIKRFVMVAAYIDESGTHSASSPLAIAITAADLDGWTNIGRQWGPAVAALPDGYHAKRCDHLHGLVGDLLSQHSLFSSFITIKPEEYHRHVPKWAQSLLGGPYAFGVLLSMAAYARWARDNDGEPAYYFVEQGHKNFDYVSLLMSAIALNEGARKRYAMAGWAPATKLDLPIHFPDTISHHAAEWYGTGKHGPLLDQLYSAGKLWRGDLPEELIAETADKFREVARMGLRLMKDQRRAKKTQRRKESGGS